MHLDAWSASFEHLTLEEIQYRTVLQFHMKELLSNILSGTYSFVIVCPQNNKQFHTLKKWCHLAAIFGENPIGFSQWPLKFSGL